MDSRVWKEAGASVVPVGREDAAALLSHLLHVLPEGALTAKGYNKVTLSAFIHTIPLSGLPVQNIGAPPFLKAAWLSPSAR